ncbi:MAG TPA: acyltransferase [Candidatus Acidoferrum sp.]|nr:acyltransferase [Candidatus Acidoferrum sp.]
MQTGRPQGRIPELDGIRGIAILLVIITHYFYFYPAANHHPQGLLRNLYVYFERCIAIGWSGVDLFFVLSGFLIGGILLDARSSRSYFRTFYFRRFFRIIPVYYCWISLYVALLLLTALTGWNSNAVAEPRAWYEVGGQYLFFQNLGFINYAGLGAAWFLATWSLAVEEQFYLVAPLVVRLLSSRALLWFLTSVILVAPFFRLWTHHWSIPWVGLDAGYALMPSRADGLAVGMLVALLWRNDRARAWLGARWPALYWVFAVFFAGFIALNFFSPSHDSVFTQTAGFSWLAIFFALLIILALVKSDGPIASFARIGWLREFGRVSYCLYIIHLAVNRICQSILVGSQTNTSDWRAVAVPIVALVAAFVIARLSWTYLERPMLQRGHAFKYEVAAEPQATNEQR